MNEKLQTRAQELEKIRRSLESGLRQGKNSMQVNLENAPEKFNFIEDKGKRKCIGYAVLKSSENGKALYELRRCM